MELEARLIVSDDIRFGRTSKIIGAAQALANELWGKGYRFQGHNENPERMINPEGYYIAIKTHVSGLQVTIEGCEGMPAAELMGYLNKIINAAEHIGLKQRV